jgi:CRISPR-associated exonuclease Cas4
MNSMSPIPLSALQHWLNCPRQCLLIHLEREWEENRFTAEGRVLHERADQGPDESRAGVRITRGMPVTSTALGLAGACDVVEFHRDIPEWIVPVEYKRGKPKTHRADKVQRDALRKRFDRKSARSADFSGWKVAACLLCSPVWPRIFSPHAGA